MKLANLLKGISTKKEADTSTELNQALDHIVRIEQRRGAADAELNQARKNLEAAQTEAIDGNNDGISEAVQAVVAAQATLESLDSILRQAKNSAVALVAAGSAAHKKRLTDCEEEIAVVRRKIDIRRIQAYGEFAKKHGLRVSWPTKNNGGAIMLPACVVDGEEAQAIMDKTVTMVHADEDSGRLTELQAERGKLVIMTRTQPDGALDYLLAERRRK